MPDNRTTISLPLHRYRTRFTNDMAFMARRELRSFGAVVLYKRSDEASPVGSSAWHRVAAHGRWSAVVDFIDSCNSAGAASNKPAHPPHPTEYIDLVDEAAAVDTINLAADSTSADFPRPA